MATLTLVDCESSTKDFDTIQAFCAKHGVTIGQFALSKLAKTLSSLDTLSDEQRNQLLDDYRSTSQPYRTLQGFREDVICLYPEFKHMDFVLEKFKSVHYHYESEHWYYIDGCSGFGFLGKDGQKFIVEICAGEHITVPEGMWQWVIPPADRRMKAMRFFSTTGTIRQPEEVTF